MTREAREMGAWHATHYRHRLENDLPLTTIEHVLARAYQDLEVAGGAT